MNNKIITSKTCKEFHAEVLWGKIAMVSWGDPSNEPVLLVHGYMDSAATFILLVDQLPDDYYYVAFDMPGHGKSDPFPPGLAISVLNIIEVIRKVTEHLKWKRFIYLAHSMGCIIGIFYNHLFPTKITKMIQLDPGPHLSSYYFVNHRPMYWYNFYYIDYYEHYKKWNSNQSKLYTYEEAINLLVRSRSLSEEQAEVILSRSLIPVDNDMYKLSWEPRMKKISTVPISEDTLFHIISMNTPPTLTIVVSENNSIRAAKKFATNIIQKCEEFILNYSIVKVDGAHDIHITNPEAIAPSIKDFLDRHYDNTEVLTKSKL